MNPGVHAHRAAVRLGLANGPQRAVRGMIGLASLVFLALVVAAGGDFHPLFSLALVALTLLVVAVPDTSAPLFLVLGLAGLWAVSLPGRVDAWTLAAAVDLLVLHLACTLASYGPPQLELAPRMFLLWGRRGVVVVAATALVWLAARLLASVDPPDSELLFATALGLLLGWAGFLWLRLLTRDGVPPS